MIKKLQLLNFRSHADVTLDFKPGVNVITGNSDSGKSNVIRGLRWLLFNRPSGFSMRSHWAKGSTTTGVTATLSDNVEVARLRNNSKNEYTISTLEEPLEAVRTDVPDPIRIMMRVDEVNMQAQGDRPFLLDDSPPDVARTLNAVAGLDGIDSAHTRIAAKIRENQDEGRVLVNQLANLDTRLATFEDLDNIATRVDAYLNKRAKLEALRIKCDALAELVECIEVVADRYSKTGNVDQLWTRGGTLAKTWATTKTNKAVADGIGTCIAEVARTTALLACTTGSEATWVRLQTADGLHATYSRNDSTNSQLERVIHGVEAAQAHLNHSKNFVIQQDALDACKDRLNKSILSKAELALLANMGVAISAIEKRLADTAVKAEAERILNELQSVGTCPTCGAANEHWSLDATR